MYYFHNVCTSIHFWWIFTRETFRAKTQLKKFTAKTGFFFPPLSRPEFEREMHGAVTRFASYWPLAVASAARDAFTHMQAYTGPSHRTLHAKFPHRRGERIFAIGCSNPVGPPSATCDARSLILFDRNITVIENYETPFDRKWLILYRNIKQKKYFKSPKKIKKK